MNDNLNIDFKKLKQDITPRPEWVDLSRNLLLSKIKSNQDVKVVKLGLVDYLSVFTKILKIQMLEPAVVMLLVLGVFLGSSLTINAAFYSLPGDNLYPVKISLEKTHVAFVTDQNKKAELKMEFVQKRVAELNKIVAQTDVEPERQKKRIAKVVAELKNNVVAVNDQIDKISADIQATNGGEDGDASSAVRIAISLTQKSVELVKDVEEVVEGLVDTDNAEEVVEIVAGAVIAVQEVTEAAEQLAVDAEAIVVEEAVNQEIEDEEIIEENEDKQGQDTSLSVPDESVVPDETDLSAEADEELDTPQSSEQGQDTSLSVQNPDEVIEPVVE